MDEDDRRFQAPWRMIVEEDGFSIVDAADVRVGKICIGRTGPGGFEGITREEARQLATSVVQEERSPSRMNPAKLNQTADLPEARLMNARSRGNQQAEPECGDN